ncbi:GNAT family N-acetyltransferase [Planococcus lenghuensis]|nr:GNAT family N-acetyltransferase [Planococcus lenghuensis]
MEIRKARAGDEAGIIQVCSEGYWHTYKELLPENTISQIITDFYTAQRVAEEIRNTSQSWNGWFVVDDGRAILGAGEGGFIGERIAELFVLYLEPSRKQEGIGSRLLEMITQDQISRGAVEQWVSVSKGNEMGIPFYEACGFELQREEPMHGVPGEHGFRALRYRRILR